MIPCNFAYCLFLEKHLTEACLNVFKYRCLKIAWPVLFYEYDYLYSTFRNMTRALNDDAPVYSNVS